MCIDPNQNHLQKVFSKMRQKRFCMWWGILICETYKISGNILKHFWQSESLVLGQTPFQFMGIDVWCCVATTPEAPLLYLWFHVKLSTMMDTPHYKHPNVTSYYALIIICMTISQMRNLQKSGCDIAQRESLVSGQTTFHFMGIDLWCCMANTISNVESSKVTMW